MATKAKTKAKPEPEPPTVLERAGELDAAVEAAEAAEREAQAALERSRRTGQRERAALASYYEDVAAGEREPDEKVERELREAVEVANASVTIRQRVGRDGGFIGLDVVDERAEAELRGATRAKEAALAAQREFYARERNALHAAERAETEAAMIRERDALAEYLDADAWKASRRGTHGRIDRLAGASPTCPGRCRRYSTGRGSRRASGCSATTRGGRCRSRGVRSIDGLVGTGLGGPLLSLWSERADLPSRSSAGRTRRARVRGLPDGRGAARRRPQADRPRPGRAAVGRRRVSASEPGRSGSSAVLRPAAPAPPRACRVCGESMDDRSPQARYCSNGCRAYAGWVRADPDRAAGVLLRFRSHGSRRCETCGAALGGRRLDARFCSESCRSRHYRETVESRSQSE